MIGWADVRWRFRRERPTFAGVSGAIALELLRPADEPKLAAAIAYYEALVGEPRLYEALVGEPRLADEPATLDELLGDYRLARGLRATLAEWYRYRTPTLAEADPAAARTLLPHGVERPVDLRRRLWERVNRDGGFAAGAERKRIIAEVAAGLGIDAEALWRLARLDADHAAILERAGEPPDPAALRLAYNRDLVEATLARAETVTLALPGLDGPTARHLIARCRRLGLVCDLEAEPDGGLRLDLYGRPEQVGPAGGYGRQLATTAIWLLGSVAAAGWATVLIGRRRYALALDRALLQAIGAGGAVREAAIDYDSAAEERLHREWRVAEARGYHAGWRVEREPELIVAGGQVLLPDFRLERGVTRLYVELVGFWTPAYVERKRRKLEAAGAAGIPLLLAVEETLRERLGTLPLPTIWYRDSVGWTEVVAAAERYFGGGRERAESAPSRLAALAQHLRDREILPEPELGPLLDLHTRGELERALAAPDALPDGWLWIAGAGLIRAELRGQLNADLLERLGDGGLLPLDQARAWLAAATGLDAAGAEALLATLDGLTVDWADLFQPIVRRLPPVAQ